MYRRLPLILGLFVLACGTASAQPEKSKRQLGDSAIEARRILKKYCGECHGKNPTSQPAGSQLSILKYDDLVSPPGPNHPLPFVKSKDAKNSHLLELIECGSMPPGGRKRPSEDEVSKLRDWIENAAPSYPAEFDNRYVLEQILRDYESNPKDAEHVRYLSFAHLVANDTLPPDWQELKKRYIQTPLTRISQKGGLFVPIDGPETVYRADLRGSGLLAPDQFILLEERKPKGAAQLTPYDLVLLEYPHGFTVTDPALAARLKPYFADARLLRNIPFVRGDWFANVLSVDPKPSTILLPTPLCTELQDLATYANTEPNKQKTLKASESELFKNAKPVVATPTIDGWLPMPPFSAVYSLDVSTANPTFTLKAEIVGNGKPIDSVIVNKTEFSILLESNRPAYFHVLNVQSDGDTSYVPIARGNYLDGKKPRALLPGSIGTKEPSATGFKLTDVPKDREFGMEYYIILASEEDIPLSSLQFVRSRHRDGQIFRFLFDPPALIDPTKVIRKVLPLKVTAK